MPQADVMLSTRAVMRITLDQAVRLARRDLPRHWKYALASVTGETIESAYPNGTVVLTDLNPNVSPAGGEYLIRNDKCYYVRRGVRIFHEGRWLLKFCPENGMDATHAIWKTREESNADVIGSVIVAVSEDDAALTLGD